MTNLIKTNYVTFHNKTCKIANTLSGLILRIDHIPLLKIDTVNFLSVLISSNMHWDAHIDYLIGKVSKCIGILYKLKKKKQFLHPL